jgi:hypothetical protein
MADSIVIKAEENRNVYIDQFDNAIWLSIQMRGGSAYCVIPREEAQKMVDTLIHFLAQEVTE